jgi:hypothetical protein
MPFAKFRAQARNVREKIVAAKAAVERLLRSLADFVVRKVTDVRQFCHGVFVVCVDFTKAWAIRAFAKFISVKERMMSRALAYALRRVSYVVAFVAVLVIGGWTWYNWPPAHHHHPLYRPGPRDVIHRVLPRSLARDTRNGDFYYLTNIVFIPFQTALLLIAGFFAQRTLTQNKRFKQHEVETQCIGEYLAIEQRLIDAGEDHQKIQAAVRAYWILIVYEHYWWSNDLLSRELFTSWCEFRMQRFRQNPVYPFGGPPEDMLGFRDYRGGYRFSRAKKIFRSGTRFDKLMLSLMARADENGARVLRWEDIEIYRHGFGPGF